jgi:hypothetical protein
MDQIQRSYFWERADKKSSPCECFNAVNYSGNGSRRLRGDSHRIASSELDKYVYRLSLTQRDKSQSFSQARNAADH